MFGISVYLYTALLSKIQKSTKSVNKLGDGSKYKAENGMDIKEGCLKQREREIAEEGSRVSLEMSPPAASSNS